jgi:hypothetical protein
MKKFVPLILGLLLPLAAFAQDGAEMDAANQTIINVCKDKGGTYIAFKDDKCEYMGCAYVGKNGDVSYDGNNERVNGGCSINDYRNKAKAQFKAEIDAEIARKKEQLQKELDDLERKAKDAEKIGAKGGSGSGYHDAGSGSGSNSGSGSGSSSGNGTGNGTGNGSSNGSGSGSIGVGGSGGGAVSASTDWVFASNCAGYKPGTCTTVCYNQCKEVRNWKTLFLTKVSGLDRSACRDCMLANSHIFGHLDSIVSYEKERGTSRATPNTTGVTLNTGSGVGGSVGVGGSIGVGGGNGGGGIVVTGGGRNWPEYCDSPKQSDRIACDEWMAKYSRFNCSYGSSSAACEGDIRARYDISNCVNCQAGSRQQS